MIDRGILFSRIRSTIFGGSLTQAQVDGIGAILDAWEARPDLNDLRQLAYVLATPMIETGGSFKPMAESLNYSVEALRAKFPSRITQEQAEQYGRKKGRAANQEMIGNIIYGGSFGLTQLGNSQPGDGYRFRGRGLGQLTGRRNYQLATEFLRTDLVSFPDRALEVRTAAAVLLDALTRGWFTGKKLSDYISGSKADFVNARRTINGLDRAQDIAAYAVQFNDALAYSQATAPRRPAPPPPDIEPAPEAQRPSTGFLAWLLGLFGIGRK